jgi:hypothetical protein
MTNFYTDSEQPLMKVSSISYRGFMLTSPRVEEKRRPQPSPLAVITKFLLGELEAPTHVRRATSKRIKECRVDIEKHSYVQRELARTIDPTKRNL